MASTMQTSTNMLQRTSAVAPLRTAKPTARRQQRVAAQAKVQEPRDTAKQALAAGLAAAIAMAPAAGPALADQKTINNLKSKSQEAGKVVKNAPAQVSKAAVKVSPTAWSSADRAALQTNVAFAPPLADIGSSVKSKIQGGMSGFSVGRDRDEGAANAARSFMDSQENKGPAVQGRQTDPNSGKAGDMDRVKGLTDAQAKGRRPKTGPNTPASLQEQAETLGDAKGPGAKTGSGQSALDKLNPMNALRDANSSKAPTATAAPIYNRNALQTNVGFGTSDPTDLRSQGKALKDNIKDTASDPLSKGAKGLDKAGKEANKVLSSPAGPGQAKVAAQKLSDANSAVPRALQGGASKAVDAVTPTAFARFDTAALHHNAALEV